jgi:1-acyl-sn-glycerol-3-phosphate acyltransferase
MDATLRLAYATSQFISRCIFLSVARRRVLHPERAALPGPWLLASNHISHFDPLLITSVVPKQIDWMAMADLFNPRLLGAWLRAADTFPVQRFKADRTSLRIAIERLKAGKTVGMFPEGGIRDGAASVLGGAGLRRGIRAVAEIGGAPIVPCVILGSDRLYNSRNWIPLRRVPVWIGFGQPLQPGDDAELDALLGDALRSLAGEMRVFFSLTDDDFPKPPRERMAAR